MKRRRQRGDELVIEIGEHTLPVVVTAQGEFWAEWEGTSYHSTTLKGLRAKLIPHVKEDAKRCEIAVLYRNYSGDPSPVTLIGIHADNGNALYVDEEGKTHQASAHHEGRFMRLISAEEDDERKQLIAAVDRAQEKLRAWHKARAIIAGDTIRRKLGLPIKKRERGYDIDYD